MIVFKAKSANGFKTDNESMMHLERRYSLKFLCDSKKPMMPKYIGNYSNRNSWIVENNQIFCNIALFAKNKEKLLMKI